MLGALAYRATVPELQEGRHVVYSGRKGEEGEGEVGSEVAACAK